MFICFNCRQFVSGVQSCDNCKKDVCERCILIYANVPRYELHAGLCSRCQCAGCIQIDINIVCVGYDICRECGLQYCSDCFSNACGNLKKHIK